MSYYRPTNQVAKEAREDTNLLKLALDQMWPVNGSQKQGIVDRQVEIINDLLVPSVVRTMAAKNLVSMGISNLKAIELMVRAGLSDQQPKALESQVTSEEELIKGTQRLLENHKPSILESGDSEQDEWESVA